MIASTDLIASVIAAERAGRKVAAGLGLVTLRMRVEHSAQDWHTFVGETFPFGLDRAQALIGGVVLRKGMMHCTQCGTRAVCECGCGAPYVSDHAWAKSVRSAGQSALERAAQAIAAHPEKSNRVIAQELGIGEVTVRRARDHGAVDGAVDRIGADGRIRKVPRARRSA